MNKDTQLWSVEKLQNRFSRVNFPEYQREPNVWSKAAKQRLIDSMLRQFDIASIYLYEDEEGVLDCIDGRQRLGAIMAFLNDNPEDKDEGFPIRVMNEIYREDEPPTFAEFDGHSYEQLKEMAANGDEGAESLVRDLLDYNITVVKLSGSRRPEEFNLQFTRLNLGVIINSGEKLHAMVGDMRDLCFGVMADNEFLEAINIPTRRYAKEQVAAQILAQIFSRRETGEWTRTRHYDLQRFFKEKTVLSAEERALVEEVRGIMTLLAGAFDDASVLRNRALSVSTVLLAWEEGVSDEAEAERVTSFVQEFVCRLLWQVGRGLDAHQEYRYLIDFQRHVTQASVERYAVEGRGDVFRREFKEWREHGNIRGDEEYRGRGAGEPSEACRDR